MSGDKNKKKERSPFRKGSPHSKISKHKSRRVSVSEEETEAPTDEESEGESQGDTEHDSDKDNGKKGKKNKRKGYRVKIKTSISLKRIRSTAPRVERWTMIQPPIEHT